MKKKITLGITSLVLFAWVILPDPLFLTHIDDVIAGIGGAASLITLIKSFANK